MAVNIVCQLPGYQTTQLEMETALGDYLQGFCKVRGNFTYYSLELKIGDYGGLWRAATAVLRIRIRRIRMFLGLPGPDPLVRGTNTDPDPSLFS
jgi:hypothetical protein